jgi:hypothetical protein
MEVRGPLCDKLLNNFESFSLYAGILNFYFFFFWFGRIIGSLSLFRQALLAQDVGTSGYIIEFKLAAKRVNFFKRHRALR